MGQQAQVSRKKRRTGDASSNTTSAAAAAIQQKDWGIAEVLAECGATLFPDDDQSCITSTSTHSLALGCPLDSAVSPSALRASVHALLREMDRNGIDPNNERVLESLEEMIASGTAAGGGDDDNDGGGSKPTQTKHGLLKRMLLPTYRVVPSPAGSSAAGKKVGNAPRDKENVGNEQQPPPGDDPATPRTPSSNDVAFAGKSGVTVLGDGRAVQTFDSSSLVRTLLRVDALQSTLLVALVQKLPEFAEEQDEEMEEVDPEATENPNATIDSAVKNFGNSALDREEAVADREEIPRLILSQIRWLDHVVDATTLTEVCLEVLTLLTSSSGASPEALTRTIILDLIATLPDIVDETKTDQIDSIVSTLTDVRNEDSTLLIPCLDALSSLRLSPEQLRGVTMDALTSLQTADIWCLPAVCKFLVQTVPASMCEDVVEALREMRLGGIDGDEEDHGRAAAAAAAGAGGADGRPGSGGGRRRRGGGAGGNGNEGGGTNGNDGQVLLRADAECLMLESFAQGMQYRPDLSSALMTRIKKTPSTDHLASDIWLLLCCAVAPHNKSQVKTIFRSKAASGGFIPDLIGEAIRGNGRALSHLFSSSALDLADGLVRSPEAEARGLGGFLYSEMFEEFHDPVQRQEVVGSLVTHVASGGSSDEIDSAMKVFSRLVEDDSTSAQSNGSTDVADATSSLRPFRPYLSSLLDYVRGMTSSQLRRLFMVLLMVGDDGDNDMDGPRKVGVGGCDDVQIVIRKYLAMPSAFLKRIGIIGGVAYAVAGSANIFDDDVDPEATEMEEGNENQSVHLSDAASDVISMLDSVRDSCGVGAQNAFGADSDESNGDNALAYFLDELCLAVRGGRLAAPVKAWILDNYQGALEEFLGDLTDPTESEPSEDLDSQMVIDDPSDRAIVLGTSGNRRSPRGALRFNIDEGDAVVYVKFLSLAASDDALARSSLTQLCPLLRLLATCYDSRYDGQGLGEIDAVVGCPLFLPRSDVCSCEGFHDLFPAQQLAATVSSFYAASWCRELVNTFIHSAAFPPNADDEGGTVPDESSQGDSDPQELRSKLVEKIKALIEIQEDLKFCSSKAPQFTPPGLAPSMPPKEVNDLQRIVDEEYDSDDDMGFSSDKEREKEVKKRTKIKDKARTKLAKARKKYEESLSERALGALRPINSLACLALGFPECSVIDAAPGASQALSMCAGEMRKLKVGGPVETLLFGQLQKTIDEIFPKKKVSWLKSSNGGNMEHDEQSIDNPYASQSNHSKKQAVGSEKFKTLDEFLAGYVFGGLYEHMATIAEIRGGADTEDDGEDDIDRNDENLLHCTGIIFACVRSLLDADPLTASSRGRKYLEQIMKQMTTGDRTLSYEVGDRTPFSLPSLRTGLSEGFTMIEEMVMGGETDDLAFAMEGVETLEAFLNCALRVETALGNISKGAEEPAEIQGLRKRLSEICHKLLRRTWSDDAKYNKSTVGKLVTLYIDYSCSAIPSNIDQADKVDTLSLGRLNALSVIVDDMLLELANTEDCKGPVDAYPTCSSHSFGTLFSAVLNFIPNELAFIHASPLASSNKTAHKTLEYDLRLIELFCKLFKLTKDNPSLAKKPHLLSQLKAGSAFLHTFNVKAVKFLEKHFQDNQKSSIEIIGLVQKMTGQMGNVISYAKREKDSALIKETPRAKRLMEAFLHKIKVLMRKNNCLTAIWQANLKEKNIDGTVYKDKEEGDEEESSGEEDEEGSEENDDGEEEEEEEEDDDDDDEENDE